MTKIPELEAGTVISHYTIDSLIGRGGYGNIYKVSPNYTDKKYAMKVELKTSGTKEVQNEVDILKKIQGPLCFPTLIDSGKDKTQQYSVMELYGPSIAQMRSLLPDGVCSPYLSLLFAIKMLESIREFHKSGFVHCDIKPGNFLIRANPTNLLVLIDFGIAQSYLDKDGNHIPQKEGEPFKGTVRYSSLNAQHGESLSRRDDLISWFYSVVELYAGRLPWPGAKDREQTAHQKSSVQPSRLCKGMPQEFIGIYTKLNVLEFSSEPPYDEIIGALNKAMKRLPEKDKAKYDWEYIPESEVKAISQISLVMSDEIEKPDLPPIAEKKHKKDKKEKKEKANKKEKKEKTDKKEKKEKKNEPECVIF